MLKHPNATVAGTGSGAGVAVVWILGNIFHIDISAETGAAIAGGVATVALLIGRHGVRGIVRLIWRGAGAAALVALLLALLAAGPAAAKKPRAAAATTATLTASWADGKLVLAGCGYDILIDGGVKVVFTRPDGSTLTGYIGIWNDGPATDTHPGASCLDWNYTYATQPGTWTIDTYQAGLPLAEATVDVPAT